MPRVLISSTSFDTACREARNLLLAKGYDLRGNPSGKPLEGEALVCALEECVGAIAGLDRFTADVIERCPELRVISRYGVGLDSVDLDAATRAGIVVTYTPGANTQAVADLTIALILACARRIVEADQFTKAGKWAKIYGRSVWQRTIGIVGTGAIGRAVAKRLAGFEARLLFSDIAPDLELARATGGSYVDLRTLLSESDFVTVHVPLGPKTRGLISAKELAMMKPSAYLINTARGGVVDEGALCDALRNRRIAGAALDVFSHEPPAGSEILACENVITTPHMGSYTYETLSAMGLMAAHNLIDVLEGRRPEHVANQEVFAGDNRRSPGGA